MSVDFPAPFGPSSPMAWPWSDAVRFRRISRLPKRTVRSLSSTKGGAPGCTSATRLLVLRLGQLRSLCLGRALVHHLIK